MNGTSFLTQTRSKCRAGRINISDNLGLEKIPSTAVAQ